MSDKSLGVPAPIEKLDGDLVFTDTTEKEIQDTISKPREQIREEVLESINKITNNIGTLTYSIDKLVAITGCFYGEEVVAAKVAEIKSLLENIKLNLNNLGLLYNFKSIADSIKKDIIDMNSNGGYNIVLEFGVKEDVLDYFSNFGEKINNIVNSINEIKEEDLKKLNDIEQSPSENEETGKKIYTILKRVDDQIKELNQNIKTLVKIDEWMDKVAEIY